MNKTKDLSLLVCLLFTSCQVKEGGKTNDLIDDHTPYPVSVTIDPLQAVIIANQSSYVIRGDCYRSGENVQLSIGGMSSTTLCTNRRFSSGALDLSSLSDRNPLSVSVAHSGASATRQTVKDTLAPTVNTTTISPGNRLPGQILNIVVTFDEIVRITGTPRIELAFDTLAVTPSYALALSRPPATTLTFRYMIRSGDADPDGIDLEELIQLSGGSLSDQSGNPVNLSLSQTNFPSVLVASTAPFIAIVTPANNSFINAASDSASFPISGICDVPGVTVSIEIDGAPADTPSGLVCDGVNFIGTIDSTSLAEGPLSFIAYVTGPGGSSNSAAHTVTKDINPPTITLDPPDDVDSSNVNSYSLSGNCSEDDEPVSVSFGALTNSANCSSGTWLVSSWNVSSQADDPNIAITADHSDAAGNPAPQEGAFINKDTTL